MKNVFLLQYCAWKHGPKGHYTIDIFACDIAIKRLRYWDKKIIEMKRHWDKKIFFSSKNCNDISKYPQKIFSIYTRKKILDEKCLFIALLFAKMSSVCRALGPNKGIR